MNAEKPQTKSIFGQALAISGAADRAAYLERACAGDEGLRAEVEGLLAALENAGDFMKRPAELSVATIDSKPGWNRDHPAAAGPQSEAAGSRIGPYKLLQQIGEGGMGTVFMAEQIEPVQRKVALKVIKPGMDSRHVIARFEAERQALALMDHPNIARVLDANTTESGRPYFVMELVKGIPITKYCDEHHLTPKERLELFVPVCQAVQHAHQKGIIHRDLKPSNVLVAQYDGRPVPKVIDFGVAKATGTKLTEATLFTEFGQVVGTIEYMSPEQAELNQLDIDTRSDIYALGVLLYELLTGTTPLDRKRLKTAAILEALRLIREEEPPRPSTRLSTTDELPAVAANRSLEPKKLTGLVRGELDWIVMKCLEKDRNRRYETANGLAQDIERHLADEPVAACPPSAAYRLRKLIRRHKVWFGTAALVATVLIASTAVSTDQAFRARAAESVADEERGKAERLAQTEAEAHAKAREQTRLANERAEHLARRAYIYRVNLGHREALENNVAQADALLDDWHPGAGDPARPSLEQTRLPQPRITPASYGYVPGVYLDDRRAAEWLRKFYRNPHAEEYFGIPYGRRGVRVLGTNVSALRFAADGSGEPVTGQGAAADPEYPVPTSSVSGQPMAGSDWYRWQARMFPRSY